MSKRAEELAARVRECAAHLRHQCKQLSMFLTLSRGLTQGPLTWKRPGEDLSLSGTANNQVKIFLRTTFDLPCPQAK